MDRGLWMVVGKVSGLMIIAGLIGVARADPLTSGIALIGVVTYGLAMYNILVYDDGKVSGDHPEAAVDGSPADRWGF